MHAKILSLIKMFPCILLSMVAFYQYHRVHSSNLNPWKGGGFGMFSSINPVYKRKLSVSLVAADGKVVRIPLDSIVRSFSSASEVAQLRAKLVMEPSYERVKQMASTLARVEWMAVPRSGPLSLSSSVGSGDGVSFQPKANVRSDIDAVPVTIDEVCVELFEYNYDHDGRQLELHKLMSASENRRDVQ